MELDSTEHGQGMDTQSSPQVTDDVALSLRQFVEAWRLMCQGAPRVSMASNDGIDYVFSGVPVGFFNVALPTARGLSGEALGALAQAACEWAAPHDVPWMFVVTHECLEPGVDAASALEACGLAPALALTGMHAAQLTEGRDVPDGLALELASDDDACAASVDVNARAYGMDLEAAKVLIGRHGFWQDHVLAVGTHEGALACCAAVMLVDGYRYVAMVATDPTRQRRGFCDAVMRYALGASASRGGDRASVLHATDAGRPVYARMGYETISTHTVFMERRFLEGH